MTKRVVAGPAVHAGVLFGKSEQLCRRERSKRLYCIFPGLSHFWGGAQHAEPWFVSKINGG